MRTITDQFNGTMMIPTNSLRCRFANGSFTLHTLSLPPPLNVVYCGTMLGFAQLSFLVNIDRWGKGRAETEAMYRVGVFLYERELWPNEIIRRNVVITVLITEMFRFDFHYHYLSLA
jgi:hypothetical protein